MRNINVGAINGGNNQFNQNNYNIRNTNSNGGGKGGGDPAGEGLAILIAVFGAVVATAFFYLRHFEQIFFLLLIGVAVAGALHAVTLVPLWRDPGDGYGPLLHTLCGVVLSAAQAWVVITAFNALPGEVLDIANRPTTAQGFVQQAMKVWNRFCSYGRRLITENLFTALCIMPAIALNALYALQHLLESIARSEDSDLCAFLANRMHALRSTGAVLSVFLTIAAALAISGIITSGSI